MMREYYPGGMPGRDGEDSETGGRELTLNEMNREAIEKAEAAELKRYVFDCGDNFHDWLDYWRSRETRAERRKRRCRRICRALFAGRAGR